MAERDEAAESRHSVRFVLAVRWLSLATGIALVVVAFAAATRVADTREGLISEVVTLLAGLVGVGLLLYGYFARVRLLQPGLKPPPANRSAAPAKVPSAGELVIGVGGLALAVVLLSGLAISGGLEWAGLGLILLLPMVGRSAYLCVRFLRAPRRDWTLDLWRPKPH